MGLLDRFKKKESPAPRPPEPAMGVYSGMRVEVTAMDGRVLFVAKLMDPRDGKAELHQYSETDLPASEEPLRVRIRGYHDHTRQAVYMEGAITPLPRHVWQVTELSVTRTGNDRAFFRLDTDLPATATTFRGIHAGEKDCRLLNISVGGACIGSETAYQEGDKFLLKFQLLEDREPSVMFCEILRVIPKDDGRFQYGCKFLELDESAQARIAESIFTVQRTMRVKT